MPKDDTPDLTCERTMRTKDWTGHYSWKCGRNATHKQPDGLPLCEKHYNKMLRKIQKSKQKGGA